MKLSIVNVVLVIFVLSTSSVVAVPAIFNPEGSGNQYPVGKINLKKKIITVEGKELAYNKSTQFFDADGKKISSKDLRSNSSIKFEINFSERYIYRPTATKIWILPSMEDY